MTIFAQGHDVLRQQWLRDARGSMPTQAGTTRSRTRRPATYRHGASLGAAETRRAIEGPPPPSRLGGEDRQGALEILRRWHDLMLANVDDLAC